MIVQETDCEPGKEKKTDSPETLLGQKTDCDPGKKNNSAKTLIGPETGCELGKRKEPDIVQRHCLVRRQTVSQEKEKTQYR